MHTVELYLTLTSAVMGVSTCDVADAAAEGGPDSTLGCGGGAWQSDTEINAMSND